MVKGVYALISYLSTPYFPPSPPAPREWWTHQPGGPHMRPSRLPTSKYQFFYFSDDHPTMPGWFKGMEQIIRECRLWLEVGLPAQCPDFKCPPGNVDCCCWQVLYLQPDFMSQHSQLQELIKSHGHLCNFYLKYHCKVNFIEQYWGAAKARYCKAPQAKTISEMERTVKDTLDAVPLLQIRRFVRVFWFIGLFLQLILLLRFANRATRFISAYKEGLSGAQAAWANRKYYGHQTLPPEAIFKALSNIDLVDNWCECIPVCDNSPHASSNHPLGKSSKVYCSKVKWSWAQSLKVNILEVLLCRLLSHYIMVTLGFDA